MKTTRRVIVGLVISSTCLSNIPAPAQDAKVLILRNRVPDGITVVRPESYTYSGGVTTRNCYEVTQHVIPRYRHNSFSQPSGVQTSFGPAGMLIGWGPDSVVRGTAATEALASQGITPAIVITEDYDAPEGIAQFSGGAFQAPNRNPAVIQPQICDISIVGRDTEGNDYQTAGVVANSPGQFNKISGSINNRTGSVTAASGTSPIVITSPAHGLATGLQMTISGADAQINGAWTITLADPDGAGMTYTTADGFSLNGSSGDGTYDPGGTWSTPGATNTSPIVIASSFHSLPTGAQVTITGVQGNTAANNTWTITRINDNFFSLNSSTGNGAYTSGGIWTSDYWHDRWHGAFVRASGPKVHGVNFGYIAGTALRVARGGGLNQGGTRWYDREKFRVGDININRAYRGIELDTVDGVIDGAIEIAGCRDYGLKITSGAVQIGAPIHVFGVSSGNPLAPSPAAWFSGSFSGYCWGGPWYVESSDIGMLIDSSSNGHMLGPIYSHTCSNACLWINGSQCEFTGVYVNLPVTGFQPYGVIIGGQYDAIQQGTINVPVGGTGIYLPGATGNRLLNLKLIGNDTTGTVTNTTGNGVSPIVISSANHGLLSGARVTVSGVPGNTAANGTFTINVIDTNLFSLDGTTGNGNYMSGGTWKTDTRLIDLQDGSGGAPVQQINYSVIDIHVYGGAIALDLRNNDGSSRIGNRNTIRIRTPTSPAPPVRTLDLPASWTYSTNDIEVNDIKVMRSITNVTGTTTVTVTSVGHGLSTGEKIFIADVVGFVGANTPISGTGTPSLWTITRVDDDTFTLNGATGSESYATGTGWWGVPRQ